MGKPLLFINYRTDDTGTAAAALAKALKREFDPQEIFIDYLGIQGGARWREVIRERLKTATCLFVLIGKDWLRSFDSRTGKDDWVLWEIEFALREGKTIVPILVDDVSHLDASNLPFPIHSLSDLQTRPFRTTVAFEADVKRLVTLLQDGGFRRNTHPWRVNADSVYNRIELHRFVGREWLSAKLDHFLRTERSGYFILEAQSGIGKTAYLAQLAETRGYIHHFVELQPGISGIVPGLRNLAAQVVRDFALKQEWIDDLLGGMGHRADFLERLLATASSSRRDGDPPIVIVVDGLDQAGTPEGQNVLGLPDVLPDGCFFVVSQRPVKVRLQTSSARTIVRIDSKETANLADLQAYIRNSAPVADSVAAELLHRSEGNWVYVHHVCKEIRAGRRNADDLLSLPHGLWQYYARFWMQWRSDHSSEWATLHLPILSALAAARESLSLPALVQFSGTGSADSLSRVVTTDWRGFLNVTLDAQGEHFELYHASLRDFAAGMIGDAELTSAELAFVREIGEVTRKRHSAMAELSIQAWGGPSLPTLQAQGAHGVEYRNEYGWRHVVEHLVHGGDARTLKAFLTTELRFA
jgi:hypothetical protein